MLPALRGTFAGAFSIAPGPATLDAGEANAAAWLADRAEQIALLVEAGMRGIRAAP